VPTKGVCRVIKPLLDEVERLRAVMTQHNAYLSKTESATRYAVIDPVLKLLGWDVHDAASVLAEYRSGAAGPKFVDYALMGALGPAVLIEAKSLGTNLALKDLEQLSNYCVNCQPGSVRWGILTNGDRWELVDAHRVQVPLQKRIVLDFSISSGTALVALRDLVSLFGLVAGHAEVAQVGPTPTPPKPKPKASAQPGPGLPSLLAAAVSGSKAPGSLRLPDGKEVAVSSWSALLRAVAIWLAAGGLLTASACPIADAGGKKRFLVNSRPVHHDGTPFKTAHQLGDGLLLESNYSAGNCARNAIHLLRVCGVDPETVHWQA